MSAEKFSSDEVPQKFVNWLLDLGCPAEKIPSIEKMTGMCRGQYYMVWRGLIEHVQAKDVIRQKRLAVYFDDIKQCQEKKILNERGSNTSLPEQLVLWKENSELKEKVKEAETCVSQVKIVLDDLMDKSSSKVIQRNSLCSCIGNLQRQAWLLSQVSNEHAAIIANLEEARSIAVSLASVEGEHNDDIESKIDKFITMQQHKNSPSTLPLSTPVASSSIVSNHENETANCEKDDLMSSLVKCGGDVLWPHLYEKRASIDARLSQSCMKNVEVGNSRNDICSLLAYTRGLHASLAFESIKKKVYIKRTQEELAASIEHLNSYNASEDAYELLVVLCEKARKEARLKSIEASLEELKSKSGVFQYGGDHACPIINKHTTLAKITSIDKSIVSSRDELRRLFSLLDSTEYKIGILRECLLAIFNALHNNTALTDNDLRTGIQLDFPTESIPLLRNFYTKRWQANKNIANVSLNLDISDGSFADASDPKLIDELMVYLKKFHLEKNRKLVLDSGEKIWTFETLKSLSSNLCYRWVRDDIVPLLCPAVRTSRALLLLCDTRKTDYENTLGRIFETFNAKYNRNIHIDVTGLTNQEADTADKIKKQIAENLIVLQRIHKNLAVCEENLQFWSEHQLKQYISDNRSVNGKTFKNYETFYLEKLMLDY